MVLLELTTALGPYRVKSNRSAPELLIRYNMATWGRASAPPLSPETTLRYPSASYGADPVAICRFAPPAQYMIPSSGSTCIA